jgi:signal transduction histidine kinase
VAASPVLGSDQKPEFILAVSRDITHRKHFEGIGIGLATCHRVIERAGGRIWVESQVGEGSKFQFVLPKIGA